MSMFVIRENFFGYNDEVFYVSGSRIASIFQNQQEAELHYKKLEIAAARNFELYEISTFFDASLEELQKYDDFVFSRCGEHIVEDGNIIESTLPTELNDEDTFAFIQLSNMQSYQILQFEEEIKFYGLWSLKNQDWIKEYDECFVGLIYAQSPEKLKNKLEYVFSEQDSSEIVLQGSLEKLSANPTLLQAVIDSQKGLKYTKEKLKIEAWDNEALFAVNAVLSQPIFEIRPLSIETVQEIEEELKKEYDYNYQEWDDE